MERRSFIQSIATGLIAFILSKSAFAQDGNINRHTFQGKVWFTPIGGIAISLVNSTGAESVQGTLIKADAAVDSAFDLVTVDAPDILGVVYGDLDGNQVADGVVCWVVIGGIAKVKFQAATTRGHIARMTVAGDADDAAGIAISEAYPTSPFATDKHFQECGHVLETIGGAGLALCAVHFN